MSTAIPLEPGKFYHIYNRGNNGENIFIAERNYGYFLKLYFKHIEPVAQTVITGHYRYRVIHVKQPQPKN